MVLALTCSAGCRPEYRDDLDYSYSVQQTWPLEDLNHGEIVQFESVFWDPDDTVSLRKLIVDDRIAAGRDVLEIGTGTGVLSILALQAMRSESWRPISIGRLWRTRNTMLRCSCRNSHWTSARLIKNMPQAFAVIDDTERFDLILSNPPWEDGSVTNPADHAFYDPGFTLMNSLLDGLPKHLKPGGRCLLAYGHRPAIERLRSECEQSWIRIQDSR